MSRAEIVPGTETVRVSEGHADMAKCDTIIFRAYLRSEVDANPSKVADVFLKNLNTYIHTYIYIYIYIFISANQRTQIK